MKKKKKIIEEIEIIPYNGEVYNSRFISYSENGNVTGIDFEKHVDKQQLEIDVNLIPNFMSGAKICVAYNIDYFLKIKNGIIKDTIENLIDENKHNNIFYEILKSDNNNFDVLLEHNSLKKSWIVHFNQNLDILAIQQFSFFICKKNNPNFLYSSYTCDLKENKFLFELNFKTSLELDFNDLSVFTLKYFKSYQLRNIDG